jgi:hypothetical protein
MAPPSMADNPAHRWAMANGIVPGTWDVSVPINQLGALGDLILIATYQLEPGLDREIRTARRPIQTTRAWITTVTSLRPVIPPWRPETFFKVHSINRSAPGAACCAACIARSSAFCRLPFLEVPLNVFSGGIAILDLRAAQSVLEP